MLLMYKCPQCNAVMQLDEGTKELGCPFCGNRISMFDGEQCETQLVEDVALQDLWFTEVCRFSCPSCGAGMAVGREDITAKCSFCGSHMLIEEQLRDEFTPDKFIAFRVDREAAREQIMGYLSGRGVDVTFEEEQLTGIYVPFWLYDFCGEAVIEGDTVLDRHSYKVIRKGKITLEKVPLDASIAMGNGLMDSILPYNYSQLYDFQKGALSGFAAQKYDFRYDEMQQRLRDKIEKFTNKTLYDEMYKNLRDPNAIRMKKYHDSTYTVEYDRVKVTGYVSKTFLSQVYYALLPVWYYSFKKDGRNYQIAINGQTGKIAGNVPFKMEKKVHSFISQFATHCIYAAIFVAVIFWTLFRDYKKGGIGKMMREKAKEYFPIIIVGGIAAILLIAFVMTSVGIYNAKKINKAYETAQQGEAYLMWDSFDLYDGVEIPQ